MFIGRVLRVSAYEMILTFQNYNVHDRFSNVTVLEAHFWFGTILDGNGLALGFWQNKDITFS
jgi:hypothetical protein